MKNILLTGANGMLGQDLVDLLKLHGYSVTPTDVQELNITDEKAVADYFDRNKFDLVIHAAAYTDVDSAESNQEKALLINEKGSEYLAKYSAKDDIPIVYISTDYVFDGTKNSPYLPYDEPNPINVYGLSKLKGEEAIQKHNPNHYIARTSWLYGHKGKNFVETMIRLAKEKRELRVVADQVGCPTWTYDFSKGIIKIIKDEMPFGIYHICGSGHTSWHGFASKIIEFMGYNVKVHPVTTEEFPRPASRPKYSVMENDGICQNWEKSLSEYIKMRKEE